MSDLYDSLEDECYDSKCVDKSDSFEKSKAAGCTDVTYGSKSSEKFLFYLRNNSAEGEKDIQLDKTLLSHQQEKNFLPKIEVIKDKGLDLFQNTVLENHILNKQGLQLNKDGSITRSPRCETEELPFITREYRNLQFQKKKTYTTNKKILPLNNVNNQKKTIVKDVEKSENEIALKKVNSKWKKESNEKIARKNSLLNSGQPKVEKHFASNDNMTDLMKEKLLQSQKENVPKAITTMKSFKKTNTETLFQSEGVLQPSGQSKLNKFSSQKAGGQTNNFRFIHPLQRNSSCLDSNRKQIKTSKLNIQGYLSDISLTTLRPKLNYSERHQLENGFNVFHLKQLHKKVESDSNRSNFGDSVIEELPEVSNIPMSYSNSAREDEELFYQKLIERDKYLKEQNHHSARSEVLPKVEKLKTMSGSHSYKSQSKVIEERRNLKSKNIMKAANIDLPGEVDNLINLKKFSHYCSTNSSTNASKIELALKGKTYGCLANARNIFRLKAQTERKLTEEAKEENLKQNQNISTVSKKVSDLSRGNVKPNKHNSSSIGIFLNVKRGMPRYLEKTPRES